MKKIIDKFINTTTIQKVQIFTWLLTFVILIVFVILAATMSSGTTAYANTLAAVGALFGVMLIGSLFTTAIVSFKNSKGGGK